MPQCTSFVYSTTMSALCPSAYAAPEHSVNAITNVRSSARNFLFMFFLLAIFVFALMLRPI